MSAFTPPLWSLTSSQVQDYKVLNSMNGAILHPQDDLQNVLYVWRADVDRALTLKLPVPDEVIASRQRQDHKITSPAILKNAKGRPFTWSYSALNDFESCPLKDAHKRFYCDVVEQDSEALRWGNRVHTAAEKALKGEEHGDPEAFLPVAPYVSAFKAAPGETFPEFEICLSENLEVVEWYSPQAWYRGKLDVLNIFGAAARIYDYKTGKPKNDPDQLKIFAVTLAQLRPDLEIFSAKYIWLMEPDPKKRVTGTEEIKRRDVPGLWETLLSRVERRRKAWQADNFPARPSGLCPWCPAYTECKYKK
jgi:hypothetical protein